MPASPQQEMEVHSIELSRDEYNPGAILPSAPPPLAVRSSRDDFIADIPVILSTTSAVQYSPEPHQPAEYSSWTTGLCDCCSDMDICCLVWCCPCIAFGRIAQIVDQNTSSCCACGCLYLILDPLQGAPFPLIYACGWLVSCFYRRKLKKILKLQPSCVEDCCCHFCCRPCALCQEYRELQNRGYNLSLGWEENMVVSANDQEFWPPVAPTMNR